MFFLVYVYFQSKLSHCCDLPSCLAILWRFLAVGISHDMGESRLGYPIKEILKSGSIVLFRSLRHGPLFNAWVPI